MRRGRIALINLMKILKRNSASKNFIVKRKKILMKNMKKWTMMSRGVHQKKI
jgi:hypothetical protein